MITSHPSRVADHLPEQLIAMTGEKVIISKLAVLVEEDLLPRDNSRNCCHLD